MSILASSILHFGQGLIDRHTELVAPCLPQNWVPTRPIPFPKLSNRALLLNPDDPRQIKVNEIFAALKPRLDWERKKKALMARGRYSQAEMQFRYSERPEFPSECQILGYDPLIFAHPTLPDGVIKAGLFPSHLLSRAQVSCVIRKIIEEDQLDELYCPTKVLAHIPGQGNEINDTNYVVLAEKLDLASQEMTDEICANMTPERQRKILRQLDTLMIKSGFSDAHRGNFAFIKSGPHMYKLAAFDTESVGFLSMRERAESVDSIYGHLRDLEIDHGIRGIFTICGDRGLTFSTNIKWEIGREIINKSYGEMRSNKIKRVALIALPLIPIIAGIAIQIVPIIK